MNLACALKKENSKHIVEVKKLKTGLALNKERASLCNQYKCEAVLCRDKVVKIGAHERKMVSKIVTMVDSKDNWEKVYLKKEDAIFLKVTNVSK